MLLNEKTNFTLRDCFFVLCIVLKCVCVYTYIYICKEILPLHFELSVACLFNIYIYIYIYIQS